MVPPNIPRAFLIAFIAVILFGTLAGARYVFVPRDHGGTDPAFAYEQLALCLDQEGLGLFAAAQSAEIALFKNAQQQSKVQRGVDAEGNATLALGSVIVCSLQAETVRGLSLGPQEWRMLKPGPLRSAVLRVARIPLKRQAGSAKGDGVIPVLQDNFSYSASVGAHYYQFIPHFSGDDCCEITVMLGEAPQPTSPTGNAKPANPFVSPVPQFGP